jgi:hypothetical protein
MYFSLLTFITLCVLGVFTLLNISSAIPKKPASVEKALEFIKHNLNYIALGGMLYGFIALCATPIAIKVPVNMAIALVGNLLIIIMALPYSFSKFVSSQGAKVNAAILKETKSTIDWISSKDKYFGFAGAAVCVGLFIASFGPIVL